MLMVLICSAQVSPIWEDPEKTITHSELFVRQASEAGAELVCFPEQFATGWDPLSGRHIQDRNGPVVRALRRYAMDYGLAVLGSFREASYPHPRNTCIVFDKLGRELAHYSKCHLFTPGREDQAYSAGDTLGLFELAGARFGIAICYDLRFSPLFSAYARAGAEAVVVPAAWPASRRSHWDLFIRSRAAEHQLYVAGINTAGQTPVDTYRGGSMTADPTGEVIASLGEGEGLLVSDIQPQMVSDARRALPVRKDRRPGLYHRLNTPAGKEISSGGPADPGV
jgi:Predicted amidohydrolase